MKLESPSLFTMAVTALLAFVAPASLEATDITWTNASGGDWSVASNWNPPQVPGTNDKAILPLFVVVTVSTNTTVRNLDFTLTTVAGEIFDVEATPNCMSWEPVLIVTNAGAVYDLIVKDATNHPYRFYRTSQP